MLQSEDVIHCVESPHCVSYHIHTKQWRTDVLLAVVFIMQKGIFNEEQFKNAIFFSKNVVTFSTWHCCLVGQLRLTHWMSQDVQKKEVGDKV